METSYWIGIGTISASVLVVLFSIRNYNKEQKNKRIENFVNEFRIQKKEENGGSEDISALSLSGLNGLKDDQEYRLAFEKIKGLILHHPLLDWQEEVEKIGYKNFFNWVSSQNRPFTSKTINQLILSYKANKR